MVGSDKRSIWIGYDPDEAAAFAVTRESARHHLRRPTPIHGIILSDLRRNDLYRRPTERIMRYDLDGHLKNTQLWDVRSDAPMSTQFANSRFMTPHLAKDGLALFMDCDMMFRRNPDDLFDLIDPQFAVSCVKHNHHPCKTEKMGGKSQTTYPRKNWSSVMVFNCDHPANEKLTLDLINTVPGRDLHRFCWLEDHEIGELPPEWNYLVDEMHLPDDVEPAIVHWTNGAPCLAGYEHVEYAGEFWQHLEHWAR